MTALVTGRDPRRDTLDALSGSRVLQGDRRPARRMGGRRSPAMATLRRAAAAGAARVDRGIETLQVRFPPSALASRQAARRNARGGLA